MGLFRKFIKLCHVWDTKTFMRNVKFFVGRDIQELKGEAIQDCVFELDELREMLLPLKPQIYNRDESLSILEREPKSFARIGEGEIYIMNGKSLHFQKYDPLLAEKMFKILSVKRDNLYVGICNYFKALSPDATEFSRRFHLSEFSKLRRFLLMHSNSEIHYLDAWCFTGYFTCDYDSYGAVIERRKNLFKGKKIALVTGESVKAKWDYDIFELAASKQYIQAPSKNAFQKYDSILNDIEHNVSKDTLVCIILGPTATAMAADLTDMGYMAWDIGHIAKDYDAYMKRSSKDTETNAKFWMPD